MNVNSRPLKGINLRVERVHVVESVCHSSPSLDTGSQSASRSEATHENGTTVERVLSSPQGSIGSVARMSEQVGAQRKVPSRPVGGEVS